MHHSTYINLTLNLEKFSYGQYDLRVPSYLSMKELLNIVVESYQLNITITQPTVRISNKNIVLTALQRLEDSNQLHNGVMLVVETI